MTIASSVPAASSASSFVEADGVEPTAEVTPRRFGRHANAFGVIRLLLASLVIVAHVPELIDGNRSRELLTMLTGTMSFGDLAVDGFFVISGFLITASLIEGGSVRAYFIKRAARIYPGFIVASLICLLVVAPLGGALASDNVARTAAAAAVRMVLLARPIAFGAFADQAHADAGSALNTVRCGPSSTSSCAICW